MKSLLSSILPLILFFSFISVSAQIDSLVLQPDANIGKDAEVRSRLPDLVISSEWPYLLATGWTEDGEEKLMRAFIQFTELNDLLTNGITAQVDSAKLYLYPGDTSVNDNIKSWPRDYCNNTYITRVLEPWDQNTITWNNQPNVASSNALSDRVEIPEDDCACGVGVNCHFYSSAIVDVSDIVKFWQQNPNQNFGFGFSLVTEQIYNRKYFVSSDFYDSSRHPKLVVYFNQNHNISTITAQAFHDENNNAIFDGNEHPLVNQIFNLDNRNTNGITNINGTTSFFAPPGTHELSYMDDQVLWDINNGINSHTLTTPTTHKIDTTIYFPFSPTTNIIRQNIDIASSITRCNRDVNMWLTYANIGTITTDGLISLDIDELASYVSSTPPADSIAGNTLFWHYENLFPSLSERINVVLGMPGVDNINAVLAFEAGMKTEEGFGGHRAILSSELVCAYDPNDKLVTPNGYGEDKNYTLFEDTLTYTVRFQNTGNDTAFNVIIRDKIDENIDLSSFEFISSSHNVRTFVDVENRMAEFYFNDIYLPDSNVNELASHGFVKFKVIGNEGLDENTVVSNSADIYFDQNPAIVTNRVSNTLVSVLPTTAVIFVFPRILNFGESVLNIPSSLDIEIQNIGELPLNISDFIFENPSFYSEINTISIDGLDSKNVTVYFKPSSVENYESLLILKSNVGDINISLKGNGVINTSLASFEQHRFELFPNPNNGNFIIKSTQEIIQSVEVYNTIGKLVLATKPNTQSTEINLSNKNIGIFYIKTTTNKGSSIRKVVVQ